MTSVLRQTAIPVKTVTRFTRMETPSYNDSGEGGLGFRVPFPFTYENGTLDIQYINLFEPLMVSTTEQPPETDPECSFRLLGGSRLVQELGENFKEYIRAWRSATIDAGSPITIVVNAQVQRAQWIREEYVGDIAYEISTTAPSGDTYTQSADAIPTYNTVWIFNTPLTIKTIEGGVPTYITFASRLDED